MSGTFHVISRNDTNTVRTVYAAYRDRGVNYETTWFLIFAMGRWEWTDAKLYKPVEDVS